MNFMDVASGTTAGSEHARTGRNNQDAFLIRKTPELLLAIVCDGCSSGSSGVSHNEVGAWLGAHVVADAITRAARHPTMDWVAIRRDVVQSLRHTLSTMGGTSRALVNDLFLFTLVVAVVTPDQASFAAIGDGVVFVNGERVALGPYENNMPPYVAYNLVESTIHPTLLDFQVLRTLPTRELQSFLVGTDGVEDLVEASEMNIPGSPHAVGAIDRLWTEDRFFHNPDAIRRHLTLLNGGIDRRHSAHLRDDTTLVVGRRIHDFQV